MFGTYLTQVKKTSPLIHNITNYVTVNDCANVLLACGASPIMADELLEVVEITSICGGLNLNIGTLNERTIASMFEAGKTAKSLAHPIVLDPVGAGASSLRTKTATDLLLNVRPNVVRGNISEIKALLLQTNSTSGVDANVADVVTDSNLEEAVVFAKSFASSFNCIVAITGAIDIVADSTKAYVVRNGHSKMAKITGTGCMLSAMTCAFMVANPTQMLESVAASVSLMGLAGEKAYALSEQSGTSSMRMHLIDTISTMTEEALNEGARYEVR